MRRPDAGRDDRGAPWLGVRDVWQTYGQRAKVDALRGVTLEVERGDFVALTGPSGSGKSTLLHILSGLRTPTRGTRNICGHRDPSARVCTLLARQQIGVVFQSFHLIASLTAWENVALGTLYTPWPARRRRAAAMEALDRVGLAARAYHRPRELSGGEQQRVAVARSVLSRPDVVFADEPTGNLDSTSGETVLNLLSGLHAGGTTVILVTHSEHAAHRARRLVRLRDGEIEDDSGAGVDP